MDRQSDFGSIRLTNKTAIALKRCVRQEHTLSLCVASVFTACMAVAAVLLGIRWLPVVPVMTAVTVLIDAAIYVRAHTRALSLTGQAICAEAAARQLRAEQKEKSRQAQARRDFNAALADAALAAVKAQKAAPEQEKESEDGREKASPREDAQAFEETRKFSPQQAEGQTARRRRRQASLTVLRTEDAK